MEERPVDFPFDPEGINRMPDRKASLTRGSSSELGRSRHGLVNPENTSSLALTTFSTPLGWFGLVGNTVHLFAVIAGHPSKQSVITSARKFGRVVVEDEWSHGIREQFESYASGEIVDFLDVAILLPEMTPFQLSVANATRRIPYGTTLSYGELASLAGYPRAARAVGTVMSRNRFPILIPCHRVLASGGKLGGYTSVAGVDFKSRLLNLESRQASPSPVRILSR